MGNLPLPNTPKQSHRRPLHKIWRFTGILFSLSYYSYWDVCFSVLAAGANPTTNVVILADIITDTTLPAIEAAAREEANTLFAGTYTSLD